MTGRVLYRGKELELAALARRGGGEWEAVRSVNGATLEAIATGPDALCVRSRYRPSVNCEVLELPARLSEIGTGCIAAQPLAAGPPSAGHLAVQFVLRHARIEQVEPTAGDLNVVPFALMPVFMLHALETGRLIDPEIFAALYLLGARGAGERYLPQALIGDLPEAELCAAGKYVGVARRAGREYAVRIKGEGAVVMPALTVEREAILVEQFRAPLGAEVIEWPAGLIGDEDGGGDVLQTARRELLEETGYAAELQEVYRGPCAAQLTSEMLSFVVAEGARRVADGGGIPGKEEITVHRVPLQEIEGWLAARGRAGVLIDPKVYTGLYFLERKAM